MAGLIDHRGKTPKKLGGDWTDDGVPVYSAMHVKDGRLQPEGARRVSWEMYERWMKVPLEAGDVLLTSEAPLGEVAYLKTPELACLGQRLFGLRANPSILNPRYLFYLLQHSSVRNQLLGRSSGTTVKGIRQAELVQVQLELPSLPFQQAVATLLGAYDDLIENNRRRIEILEEMARLLYREWFVNFRFPGHENVGIVDPGSALMPAGWSMTTLEDACVLVMGQSPKSEFYNTTGEGLPFHQGVSDFGNRFPSHTTWTTVDKRVAEPGDILFSVRAPVGRINIAPDRLVLGRGLSGIRAKDGFQDFLTCQLQHLFAVEDIIGNGAIFNAVTKKDMQQIELLQPAQHVVAAFEDSIGPIFSLVENLTGQIEALTKARDLLLPRLVSGELDVSELDLDAVVGSVV
jgi:type I restriction enzyme S subunit